MSKVAITDYILNPDIEKNILGNFVGYDLDKDTEVLLVWHKKIDEKLLELVPNLKGVQRYGVGYDNVDLELLRSKNIIFCNNPDYCVDEVSDTTVGMILNITRRIYLYNTLSKKYFINWQENIIPDIKRTSETIVGIIGAGRIGGRAIIKLKSLGFKVVFYDKYKDPGWEKVLNCQRVHSLDELLKISDVVSIHVPLTEETFAMVNEDFLDKMKDGAAIVNTARGKIFKNLDILYDKLLNNKIAFLSVDVLPEEPPLECELINLWRRSEPALEGRVIINPHTSFYSKEAFIEMREKAALNAERILKNENPFYRIV